MTADQYADKQAGEARVYAPAEEIDEAEFRYSLSFYPLDVIRQAAVRYSAPRGRSRGKAIGSFVDAIANPHLNHGESFRLALGHVEATRRWMVDRGLQ
jgi:hypothetical protein